MREKIKRYTWAALRLSLGWVFLWAFMDKAWGLGFATESESAWFKDMAVNSPTEGFLQFGTQGGTFQDSFQALAGNAWVDWLFMLGLLGIGLGLVLGIAVRLAAASGIVMLILMWLALLPLENNPFMDDHIVYSIALIGIAAANNEQVLGFGKQWQRLSLVKRFPILR